MSRAEKQFRRRHRKDHKHRQDRERLFQTEDFPPGEVRLLRYAITDEPIVLPGDNDPELSHALKDIRDELHDELHNDPQSAIPKLEALLERFPNACLLLNWLSGAYRLTGEHDKAKRLVQRTYQLHPEYLFARLNYANLLLEDDKVDEAAQVMGNKWDLKSMYPHRDVFHGSEFIAFSQTAFRYFVLTGRMDAARGLFNLVKRLYPNHPLTAQLRRVLEGSLLLRTVEQLLEGRRCRGDQR